MSLNPAFPNDLARAGGSRGWRRHVRRWKSAYSLAARGDKTARAWLSRYNKPVPAHPHERPVQKTAVFVPPEPMKPPRSEKRLIWAGLPSSKAHSNPCPSCNRNMYESGYQETDEGLRWALTCLSCDCIYRPYVAPVTSRSVPRSPWWLDQP